MPRIEVATQSWGQVVSAGSNQPLAGAVPSINTTVYQAAVGAAAIAPAGWVSNVDGLLPGFIDEGKWLFIEPDGQARQIDAVSGQIPGRVAVLEAAGVGGVLVANARGIVADGVTDDTAAWTALIATLTDGQAVTWVGNSVVQPGLSFISRVALLGQGLRSAFTIAGGTTTNDGIVLGGADGPRYGHVARDFAVLGGAACCRRALVLRNLVNADVAVSVKAGATDYGVSLEGVQDTRARLVVSTNHSYPFAGSLPANGVRAVGSVVSGGFSGIPTNANDLWVDVAGVAGKGFYGDGSVGAVGSYNNYLSGVVQANGGHGIHLKQWTDGSIRDIHLEANVGEDLRLEAVQRFEVGGGVFVDGDTKLVDCDDITLHMTTTNYVADAACTHIDRTWLYINGGTASDASPSAWANAVLQANWTDLSVAFHSIGYRWVPGAIELRGVAQIVSGSVPSTIFTLPSGLRPAKQKLVPVVAHSAFGRLDIEVDGDVVAQAGAAAPGNFWSLDGIRVPLT